MNDDFRYMEYENVQVACTWPEIPDVNLWSSKDNSIIVLTMTYEQAEELAQKLIKEAKQAKEMIDSYNAAMEEYDTRVMITVPTDYDLTDFHTIKGTVQDDR